MTHTDRVEETARQRVLIVTGPGRNRLELRGFLEEELGPVGLACGDEALDAMLPGLEGAYDAVLVDRAPGERVPVCSRLRAVARLPILVIGDPGGADAPACLDAGADDYLAHPERAHEVAARLRARLRRSPGPGRPSHIIEAGGARIDLDRHEVRIRSGAAGSAEETRTVELPLKQFRLLELLVTHAGQVLTTRAIVEHVWGPLERVDRNTVQAHVARLRRTLGDEELAHRIRAVPGIGYTFPR